MRKIKTTAMAFSAVCVLGAVVVCSASADWFTSDSELASGSTAALAQTAKVDEDYVLKFKGVTIKCASHGLNSVQPEIAAPNKLTASSLVFGECTASGENCTLSKTTIGTAPVTAELTEEDLLGDEAVFKPQTGTVFATIKLEGSLCPVAETLPIKGSVAADLPMGQSENTLQEIKTKASSGELKVGSSEAEFAGAAELKLASGATFSQSLGLGVSSSGTTIVTPPRQYIFTFGTTGEFHLENNSSHTFSLNSVVIGPNALNFGFVTPANTPPCTNTFELLSDHRNGCWFAINSQHRMESETLTITYAGNGARWDATLRE
jgi:hypothetical protein